MLDKKHNYGVKYIGNYCTRYRDNCDVRYNGNYSLDVTTTTVLYIMLTIMLDIIPNFGSDKMATICQV